MQLTEEQSKNMVDTINSAIDHFEKAGKKITEASEILLCRQLQMISIDLSSIADHIQDFATHGPKEPWKEIPLEDSEVQEQT